MLKHWGLGFRGMDMTWDTGLYWELYRCRMKGLDESEYVFWKHAVVSQGATVGHRVGGEGLEGFIVPLK